jgi:hypothetical protein
MQDIEQILADWRASHVTSIPVGGLLSRNAVAYKWKAPFRCWLLREAAFWRVTDLLTQSYALHLQGHALGARIILRSAFETVSMLIYLNQQIQQVLDGSLGFHAFATKTSVLLLGSRDGSTNHQSINIVTILSKCDSRYPGIERLYAALSESAHPNYEGMLAGYSKVDREEHETRFSNRWMEVFGKTHLGSMEVCMMTFEHEYNDVWPSLMDRLEGWISYNDSELEKTKPTD